MSEFAPGTGPGYAFDQHRTGDGSGRPERHEAGAGGPSGGVREQPVQPRDGAGPPDEPAPEAGTGSAEESGEGPRPLGVGVRPTGHAPVDERLRRLEDADHLAVSGHQEVYEDVHRGLRETLAALDRPHTPRS
ncbi:hypothetical protein ABZ820_41320 [Streptomyces diacarni]|uniref:hypothetical protein n=1 Tax=Streptomyces diacarni TaxID=2800381 RepID=UPI00340D0711